LPAGKDGKKEKKGVERWKPNGATRWCPFLSNMFIHFEIYKFFGLGGFCKRELQAAMEA
jgi:hypothetical protein